MRRTDALVVLALILLVAGAASAAPAPPGASALSPPNGASALSPPNGASALDAFGELRDAESRTYNLAADGVHSLAVRISSPAIDALTVAGGPLAGREVELTLWWLDGESRVIVGGVDGVAPEIVESLRGLVKPLPALLIPERPSRGLVGSAFAYRNVSSILRPGEHGIEAKARTPDTSLKTALFAVSPEGLIVGERLDRSDGRASEFRHHWTLQGGRYLLAATEGWVVGTRVGAEIEWGALVGERPVPTRVTVLQADIMAPWPESAGVIEFRLSQHRLNAEPPPGLFGPPP